MPLRMKLLPVLLGALLLAAPAVGICACPEAAPKKAPMGCEGTSHCCCGETPASSSRSEDCPRAEKSVEAAEIAEKSAAEPSPAILLPAVFTVFDLASPALPARLEGRPPPSRPDHLILTALLL